MMDGGARVDAAGGHKFAVERRDDSQRRWPCGGINLRLDVDRLALDGHDVETLIAIESLNKV